MGIENEFIPYEQAWALEELGFDKPCFGYYLCKNSAFGIDLEITSNWIDLSPYDSSSCKAPLYRQAFKWFREKHSYQSFISPSNELTYLAYDFTLKGFGGYFKSKQFKTQEEAELECLIKLIEIVKEKK